MFFCEYWIEKNNGKANYSNFLSSETHQSQICGEYQFFFLKNSL